jgi:hypothetical protein
MARDQTSRFPRIFSRKKGGRTTGGLLSSGSKYERRPTLLDQGNAKWRSQCVRPHYDRPSETCSEGKAIIANNVHPKREIATRAVGIPDLPTTKQRRRQCKSLLARASGTVLQPTDAGWIKGGSRPYNPPITNLEVPRLWLDMVPCLVWCHMRMRGVRKEVQSSQRSQSRGVLSIANSLSTWQGRAKNRPLNDRVRGSATRADGSNRAASAGSA